MSRRPKPTRKALGRAELYLQRLLILLPKPERRRLRWTMALINELRADMRRKAIFEAGARARQPEPVFEGERLGSAEQYTFYDGYASKHAAFINPYRGRRA